jgi:outer membrane protein W
MIKQFLLIVSIFSCSFGFAQNYKAAVGVKFSGYSSLGGPAISYKQFIKTNAAIEALFSFKDPVALGAMYQVHKDIGASGNMQWYYGGGGYFVFSKPSVGIGVMGIIGLDYKFDNAPINLSLDFKPEFAIAPSAGFDFNSFGFAIRYVF